MDITEIGNIIRQRRQFLALNQQDVAENTGISIKTLHLLEQGKGNPSFSTLQKIADLLGMELLIQVKQIDKVYG